MKLVYTVPGSYVFPLQYAKDVKNMMIKNLTLIFLGGQKNVTSFVLKTVWKTRSLTPS